MYTHIKATEIKTGDKVIHCGVAVEVAEVETKGWIVNIAVMTGGRVSFPDYCTVKRLKK